MVIHDEEGKAWDMESAIATLQCESAGLRKRNACHLGFIQLQPLQPLPVVNPEETLRIQGDRPRLAKVPRDLQPEGYTFWKDNSKDCLQPGQKDPYQMTRIYITIKMMCRENPGPQRDYSHCSKQIQRE